MRVLVIGGTRFVGPYVVGRLVEEGCEVTVFNRGETVPPLEVVRRLRGDRRNLAGFADEFRKLAPDVVLDMIPVREREARDVMCVLKVLRGGSLPLAAVTCVQGLRDRDTGRDPGSPDPVPLDKNAPLREKFYSCKGKERRSTRIYWSGRRSWETLDCPYGTLATRRLWSRRLPAPDLSLPQTHGRWVIREPAGKRPGLLALDTRVR